MTMLREGKFQEAKHVVNAEMVAAGEDNTAIQRDLEAFMAAFTEDRATKSTVQTRDKLLLIGQAPTRVNRCIWMCRELGIPFDLYV